VSTPRALSAALVVDGLSVEFATTQRVVRAVRDVSFEVGRGETVAIVGESGSGKSVTALALMRLVEHGGGRIVGGRLEFGRPDGSRIDLAGADAATMRTIRGAEIAMIFQEPMTSLNPVFTVGEQIAESIRLHQRRDRAAASAEALRMLEQVRMPEAAQVLTRYPHQLSGGMRQRVMIAMALSCRPTLLIADEPTTALDVTIQAQILDLLAELQASQKMAMLLITHDLAIVAQVAHRVALMYAGQIVEVAEVKEFFARPSHPYAANLFEAVPDTSKRGRRLASIPGSVPALNQQFTGCRFAERCGNVTQRCRAAPPPLVEYRPGHAVRCILYQGATAAEPVERIFDKDAALPPDAAVGDTVLEVSDYRVWFPIRKGLFKRTVGHVKAVDGVSFTLPAGRTLALVGESGSGKTTVGKAVLQLLRNTARISGSARLAGAPLEAMHGEALRAARRTAQIVFQDPFASLDPRMRVNEILEEGVASLRPDVTPAGRTERVAALLERVGLRRDVLTRYPHEFSGGQRQRLAIARALAVEPKLIVADEPTSALDVSVQAQILNLLKELQHELGVAYLFITHNFGVVEYLAHEIAVMKDGRLVEAGPADQILNRPQHEYTRTLLAAVPRLHRA